MVIRVHVVETASDYQEVRAIRRQVFTEEQGVAAALEVDDQDEKATHFLAVTDGKALATGRFRLYGGAVKFERIATLAQARGQGLGKALMAAMEAEARARHPQVLLKMNAQLSAASFYEAIGWVRQGEVFYEAGIAHVAMAKYK